jgi:ribosomal protein S18 acetylase RimI-like enzyme
MTSSASAITIRPAGTPDLEACARILAEAYRGFIASDGWDAAVVEALVLGQAHRGHLGVLLAEEALLTASRQGSVVGFASVRGAELTHLYIDSQHRRQKIGSRLLAAAEREIRFSGHGAIIVQVAAASALPFYQAAGLAVVREIAIADGPCAGQTAKRLEKALR